ncbi:MAG: FtsH protease activity modulator HflK [Rhizobiales bacterium]|nr:FtsH protease activity modulator HflK [Hyphomicrobiales bacterium]
MSWNNQSGGSGGGNGGGGWKSGGGGGGPWGGGGQGGQGPTPPDLEEMLKRGQERLKSLLPGSGGSIGGKGFIILAAVLVLVWLGSGFYRVQTDQQGVVLRFGEFVKTTAPGLNYHLPYPIETALTPSVTNVNRLDVGVRGGSTRNSAAGRDVPEESLMLTGDENIVDVDFTVFWVVRDAADFLFNIQNPVSTVKAIAESAMREVVGRANITPLLTSDRPIAEAEVQELMQTILDEYGAGIQITQVTLQKVDPPSQVIDSFRDVQAAKADQERARNEAQAYANQVVPEARGAAARVVQEAEAYRERSVADAQGQADRFLKIYEEYAKAPEVTRQRMFLETMERVFGGMDKIIIDDAAGGSGVVPYLSLNELNRNRGDQ